jgi:hypothetical protein
MMFTILGCVIAKAMRESTCSRLFSGRNEGNLAGQKAGGDFSWADGWGGVVQTSALHKGCVVVRGARRGGEGAEWCGVAGWEYHSLMEQASCVKGGRQVD